MLGNLLLVISIVIYRDARFKDSDWMKECNATYKLSIQFSNWAGKGEIFQYPFGDIDYTNGDFLTWYYLHYAYPQLFPDTSYCEFYNPISYLASTNKIVDDNDYVYVILEEMGYIISFRCYKIWRLVKR